MFESTRLKRNYIKYTYAYYDSGYDLCIYVVDIDSFSCKRNKKKPIEFIFRNNNY